MEKFTFILAFYDISVMFKCLEGTTRSCDGHIKN